jgi:hypothetical protein
MFVKHSRLLLDPHNKLPENGVRTTDTALVFSLSPTQLDILSMSLFAFLGRSTAVDMSMSDATKWISYDIQNDKFYLEDSACEINRDIYTTLLLFSILLLIFFIGVQVQNDIQQHEISEHEKVEAGKCSAAPHSSNQKSSTTAPPGTNRTAVKETTHMQLVFRNLSRV